MSGRTTKLPATQRPAKSDWLGSLLAIVPLSLPVVAFVLFVFPQPLTLGSDSETVTKRQAEQLARDEAVEHHGLPKHVTVSCGDPDPGYSCTVRPRPRTGTTGPERLRNSYLSLNCYVGVYVGESYPADAEPFVSVMMTRTQDCPTE